MINIFRKWIDDYFADEEAVALMVILIAALLLVIYAGHIIAPVLASVIIAYLLQGMVAKMEEYVSHNVAVTATFLFFVGGLLAVLLLAVPLIGSQLSALVNELPKIAQQLQAFVVGLQKSYPTVLSETQVSELIGAATQKAGAWGQSIVSFSLASLPNLFALMVYGVLIPILVFFFLKDKKEILDWLTGFLPEDRPLMKAVGNEMNLQVANYARGKALEIFVVGAATYVAFMFMGVNYAALLSVLVGLSVIVPYIGATAVTIPVAVIGYFQWGMTDSFGYLMLAYGIIQFLDGNVLVPILFSEAVNMHPVAIIVAVLFFGGIWGLWGVFFAIPLATLVKALLTAWPRGMRSISHEHEC